LLLLICFMDLMDLVRFYLGLIGFIIIVCLLVWNFETSILFFLLFKSICSFV